MTLKFSLPKGCKPHNAQLLKDYYDLRSWRNFEVPNFWQAMCSRTGRFNSAEVAQVARDMRAATTRNGLLPPDQAILGTSSAMREVRDKLGKIADSDVPILIRGEAGSGKEILARLIHRRYPGDASPFHKVSPAGRAGWRKSSSFVVPREDVQWADGSGHAGLGIPERPACIGTLFFDDVAELNSVSQRSLTQLLCDEKQPGPATSGYLPPLFRVICSTRYNLERAVSLGSFREDLFYSINIISLHLPPLRERREDIPGLAIYFWDGFREELGSGTPAPSSRLMEVLQAYSWPGNIRELTGVMRRYVLTGSGDKIFDELGASTVPMPLSKRSCAWNLSLKKLSKQEAREVERKIIFKALRETQWNRKRAARALNISYRTLLYKIKDAGIPPERIIVKRES